MSTGQKYGRWLLLETRRHKNKPAWLCRCECGSESVILAVSLRTGNSKSCGCFRDEKAKNQRLKHGLRQHRLYSIWMGMRKRCVKENNINFSRYGGKSISVCEEWKSDFTAFYNWAVANGYSDNLTLDRKEGKKNYEPSNCRWVTYKDQARNTISNRIIRAFGESKSLSEWTEDNRCIISYSTLQYRLNAGWSPEDALVSTKKGALKKMFTLMTALQIEDVPILLQNLANNYRGTETRRYPELWIYAAELIEETALMVHERIEQAKAQGEITPNRRERVRL